MAEQAGRVINVNVDLAAELVGYGSARSVTPAHLKLEKYYSSPWLLGPPRSELLREILCHLFNEEEAALIQHLPPLRRRTAEQIAQRAGVDVEHARRVLDRLALTKMVILAAGRPRKYAILPIVPGTFEMALMTADLTTRNSWHRHFAELFEKLWDTRYYGDYKAERSAAFIRYLPVGGVAKTLQMAWPSDRLEEVLEPYKDFCVGHCQCRLAMQYVGKGCGKATENCSTFGPMVKPLVERGMMRRVSREELIQIKRAAELEGSVTWMMNNKLDDLRGNGSCSCCGCCCHNLRAIREFNAPGLISAPHFMPKRDAALCNDCGKCIKVCPMLAWSAGNGAMAFDQARCIGCGLCVTVCKTAALKLDPVPDAKSPLQSTRSMLLHLAPVMLANTARVWARRMIG